MKCTKMYAGALLDFSRNIIHMLKNEINITCSNRRKDSKYRCPSIQILHTGCKRSVSRFIKI